MARLLFILTVLLYAFESCSGVWWTLGTRRPVVSSDQARKALMCLATQEFNTKQREICRKHPDLMSSVEKGAKDAIEECQVQFHDHRWNCSSVQYSGTLFGAAFKLGCKEAAFVNAITAAGVTQAVTASCSSGHIDSCDCDRSLSGNTGNGWSWAGCHSNVKFGKMFSEKFTNARERGNNLRASMNRHNNRVGRESVSKLLWKKCKCHGLSGSCAMRTCWMQHPGMRQIGDYIKAKYDVSVEMTAKLNKRGKKRLRPKSRRSRKLSGNDLIYYEMSPNFCDRDPSMGSLGTIGRECNISSTGIDGCELLCCGRGHNIQQATVTQNCNCRFVWCCEVICDKCREIVNIYTCK